MGGMLCLLIERFYMDDTTIEAAHTVSYSGGLIGQILLSNDIPVDDL
ncbi:MAG: hypothetical protein ACI85F_000205 [Bacteroidia bacterium]|jgi:hypothetical protein